MATISIEELSESYLVGVSDEESRSIVGGDSIFTALNQAFGIGSVDDSLITLNVFDVQ